jgi:hypothetical protein
MVINKCAQIYGHPDSAQMDGLQAIPDPLDRSAFNGGGGGGGGTTVRNEAVFPAGPVPTCHQSIASDLLHSRPLTAYHPSNLPPYWQYHTAPAS